MSDYLDPDKYKPTKTATLNLVEAEEYRSTHVIKNPPQYYEVYFNHPLNRPFVYRYTPLSGDEDIQYRRVWVPLRNKTVVGFVTGKVAAPTEFEVKDLIGVIDSDPILTAAQVDLAQWIAKQYLSSLGEALALFFSFTVSKKSPKNIKPTVPEELPPALAKLGEELKNRITLNPEQQECFDIFLSALQQKTFAPFLVHGVTGSGKTYYYLRMVLEVILQGKQALILVPEITLIFQIETLFKKLFPELILEVYHSKMSEGARTRVREAVARTTGTTKLVIATRSGFFLPFNDLGIVVMDEEHENSYKNNTTPRYQLKQIAYYRASALAIPLVLVSATPSIELYYQTQQVLSPTAKTEDKNRFTLLKLNERYADTAQPEVTILTPDNQHSQSSLGGGLGVGDNDIPHEVYQAVYAEISAGRQVIFYINQRGFSSMVYCKNCKRAEECPNCDITLTYHKKKQHLSCHYCGFRAPFDGKCISCGGEELSFVKGGTENFYEQLSARFQNYRVERFDSDHSATVKQIQAVLKDFREQTIHILVGTQMLIKGHDFKNVGLVVVLLPENYLLLPDYRSQERMFSHLMQVSGRAGRDKTLGTGRMLIVTRMPEHLTLRAAQEQSYETFYQREIEARKMFGYPPYVKLINLVFRGRKEHAVISASNFAKTQLTNMLTRGKNSPSMIQMQILGPSPCLLERHNNYYRWNILVKVKHHNQFLAELEKTDLLPANKGGVYLEIDVSPVDLF